MDTVNIQCGNCDSVMAVNPAHLGQPVRCPHCQQIVVAPTAAASDTPLDSLRHEEAESLSAPENTSDAADSPIASLSTLTAESPSDSHSVESSVALADAPAETGVTTAPAEEQESRPALNFPSPATDSRAPTAPRQQSSKGMWFTMLVLIPLISYSVMATIAWVTLRQKLHMRPPHPLEMIPDIDGDNPTRKKPDGVSLLPLASTEVPDSLRVPLGQTLTLGELEVTPLKVVEGSIGLQQEGQPMDQAQWQKQPALQLWLRLKNVSPDLAYHPMDLWFVRFYHREQRQMAKRRARWRFNEPFTRLLAGNKTFVGGPTAWSERDSGRAVGLIREYAVARHWQTGQEVGQEFDRKLKPGEEMETFVCTDPEFHDIAAARQSVGRQPLLWQVQLRRGSVVYAGRRVPVTAVIGVTFTFKDVIAAPEKSG